METRLASWLADQRRRGVCINGNAVLFKANGIARELNLINFLGSRGFLYNFLNRNSYSLRLKLRFYIYNSSLALPCQIINFSSINIVQNRRVTTHGRGPKESAMADIDAFFHTCNRKLSSVCLDAIYNMDEISIRLDSPLNRTYERIGTKRVAATTTGNEMTRLSVAFCASANGTKLPLLVVLPRKTPLPVNKVAFNNYF